MTTRTVERVDEWETTPFAGGYDGLRELASQEFSGVITAGPTRLFMLRGTVVGVLDGAIEDFEGAEGTARRAPHHSLPLLAVMQERSEEVRAKYYSEDTPLSEVDETLSDGGFTGYVELSENVLSGDYYQVYHQGRSMSVGFVGSSSRLITDDEAFETADDEVGIFAVRPVEIDAIPIPDAGGDGSASAGTGDDASTDAETRSGAADDEPSGPAEGGAPASGDAPDSSTREGAAGNTEATGGSPATGSDGPAPAGTDGGAASADASARPDGPETAGGRAAPDAGSSGADAGVAEGDGTASGDETASGDATRAESAGQSTGGTGTVDAERAEANGAGTEPAGANAAPTAGDAAPSADEPASGATAGDEGDAGPGAAADLETRAVPSLDPGRSSTGDDDGVARAGGQTGGAAPPGSKTAVQGGRGAEGGSEPTEEARSGADRTDATDAATDDGAERSNAVAESEATSGSEAAAGGGEAAETAGDTEAAAEERVEARREDVEALEAELSELSAERDDLAAERDRLRSELEDARAEIERLESQLEAAGAPDEETTAGTQLTADRAIDETNLFVRYDSKGEATLEKAHDGSVERDAVAANLRLEYHTQFDAADASVGTEPFESFLTDTIQYRFVDWLVTSLLWEIRETGHTNGMQDLYDAIPRIDRAELNGQVSVSFVEDGEEHRTQETFDVVVRDRMGNPLMVANNNESRDPATDSMMTDLVKTAERVGESSESLAGAFLVTKSFFQPEALETAEEAASSGLFSRDKRDSFVNLSRKDGFHLCLVEARNEEIHLTVPEL